MSSQADLAESGKEKTMVAQLKVSVYLRSCFIYEHVMQV